MARRFQRTNTRVPVELISTAGTDKFEQPGSIMEVCRGGLRVQTGPRLTPGQFLHVFLTGRARPFAHCRVVWAQTHGDTLPSQAGLEILEGVPAHAIPRSDIEPMASVAFHPAFARRNHPERTCQGRDRREVLEHGNASTVDFKTGNA